MPYGTLREKLYGFFIVHHYCLQFSHAINKPDDMNMDMVIIGQCSHDISKLDDMNVDMVIVGHSVHMTLVNQMT